MYKIGITSYAFEHTYERFARLRASGLEAVELCLSNNPQIDFQAFYRMAKENDVLLWSCHLPFRPFQIMDCSICDSQNRQKALAYNTEIIQKCAEIGIDKFVVHPSLPLPQGSDRNERKHCSMEMLDALAEVAHKNGAVIAVENMIPSCLGNTIEELSEIISINDKLRICFDVNHLLKNTHEAFLQEFHHKIVTVHISDYDFIQERHWVPGKGKINWRQLYQLFKTYGYNGVWLHELGLSETTEEDGDGGPTFADIYQFSQQLQQ